MEHWIVRDGLYECACWIKNFKKEDNQSVKRSKLEGISIITKSAMGGWCRIYRFWKYIKQTH